MQRRIFILLFSILLFGGGEILAQDAHFSQFYANPLYLNPAFAGSNICPRVTLNFRDQWPEIAGTFITYAASYDQHFDKLSGGIGVSFYGDRAGEGTINTYAASLMYSFRLKVSKKFQMRFALQATYQQKSLDWSKLTFGDMIDPKYGFVYETSEIQPSKLTSGCFDVSTGFIGYTKHIYFGFAAHHITRPYEGFVTQTTRLPVKWTGHFGAYFDLHRKSKKETSFGDVSISPNIIYQQQMNFHYLNEGFYLNFYPFTVGLWLRHSFVNVDALIFMCGIQTSFLRVGYSYDITLSKLSNLSGNAHEVSVQFLFNCPEKHRVIKDLNCPTF